MKKQYIKTISSVLIVGFFVFLAFGSEESSDNKNSNSSSTSSTIETEKAPNGYHKGSSCSDCSGTGYLTHDNALGYGKKGDVCAGCNGKGYHWVKN